MEKDQLELANYLGTSVSELDSLSPKDTNIVMAYYVNYCRSQVELVGRPYQDLADERVESLLLVAEKLKFGQLKTAICKELAARWRMMSPAALAARLTGKSQLDWAPDPEAKPPSYFS